jgi:CrcB protein
VLLVFVGSGLGGAARYLFSVWMVQIVGAVFPYGTVIINITGSFLIALIGGLSAKTNWISPELRLFLTTGIMGGYTTYSTFNYETLTLVQQGAWGLAAANLLGTVVFAIGGGLLGFALANLLAGAGG